MRENKIIVYIAEPFEQNVQEFRSNVKDSASIEFIKSEDGGMCEESLISKREPGGFITPYAMIATTNSSNGRGYAGTSGLQAYDRNTYAHGFVTAAHVGRADNNYIGTTYRLNGQSNTNNLGTLRRASFSYYGTVDAAFVAMGPTWSFSNYVYSGKNYSPSMYSSAIIHGGQSWNVPGYLASTSGRGYISDGIGGGTTITDMYIIRRNDSSQMTQQGDSGSAVTMGGYLIGMNVARDSMDNFVCKVTNIESVLGVTVY